jgi:hypothetical protein
MNKRLFGPLCAAIGGLLFAGSPHAQNVEEPASIAPSEEQGLSFGVRSGYGIPLGNAVEAEKFSNDVNGLIPLWLDVGYRFNRNWYLGGFFSYGFGLVPSNRAPAFGGALSPPDCSAPTSCSEYNLRFGINFHYHFSPMRLWDPWVGVGAAYEIFNFNFSRPRQSGSTSLTGFEFGNAQLGLDYRLSSQFVVGPFVAFTVAQYSNQNVSDGVTTTKLDVPNKAIHEWLMFGLRGLFTIIVD